MYGSLFSGVGGLDLGLDRAGLTCAFQVENDPYARRVLNRHWPDVPKWGDITDVDWSDVERECGRVDLVAGGFPCFPTGTNILTKRGFLDISEVIVGDEVLTHKSRWRRVTQTMRRKAPLVEMRGQGHPQMLATSEHPFFSTHHKQVWNNKRRTYERKFSEPSWAEASEMEGRYWASPHSFPSSRVPEMESSGREAGPPRMSAALMRIVGVWLGDGWTDLSQRPGRGEGVIVGKTIICAGGHEADKLQQMMEDAGLSPTRSDERTAVRFIVTNRGLSRWLREHFGRYSHGKTVPAWCLGLSEEYRRALLEGYCWADGFSKPGCFKITSVCKDLMVGMKLVSQSLGYSVSLHLTVSRRKAEIEGRAVNERPVWQLAARSKSRSSTVIGGHRYGLVRSVKRLDEAREVFNIGVEEDESYVADGLVVHNCQDLSLAGKGAGLSGARSGLWSEYVRCLCHLRPQYVIVENVPGLLSRGMGVLLGDLAALGYDAEWESVPAAAFGAPHLRWRVFIVAHHHGLGGRDEQKSGQEFKGSAYPLDHGPTPSMGYSASGGLLGTSPYDREHAQAGQPGREEPFSSGNPDEASDGAEVLAHANRWGRDGGRTRQQGRSESENRRRDIPDPHGRGREEQQRPVPVFSEHSAPERSDWWQVEPGVCGMVPRFSQRMDGGGVNANAEETRSDRALRGVRKADGGQSDSSSPEVLQQGLHGPRATERQSLDHVFEAISQGTLRESWERVAARSASSGSRSDEQLTGEFADALLVLPHSVALGERQKAVETAHRYLRDLWKACGSLGAVRDPSEPLEETWESLSREEKDWVCLAACGGPWAAEWPATPRVAPRTAGRVDRLRGLGNAVVPQIGQWLGELILRHSEAT